MLPKTKRLNLRKDFKRVASGKQTQTPHFKIMYRDGENPSPLVGIALSKAYFKKAVERNRARRLASAALEPLYGGLRKSINLVIMPKSEILKRNPDDLREELEGAIKKI